MQIPSSKCTGIKLRWLSSISRKGRKYIKLAQIALRKFSKDTVQNQDRGVAKRVTFFEDLDDLTSGGKAAHKACFRGTQPRPCSLAIHPDHMVLSFDSGYYPDPRRFHPAGMA